MSFLQEAHPSHLKNLREVYSLFSQRKRGWEEINQGEKKKSQGLGSRVTVPSSGGFNICPRGCFLLVYQDSVLPSP